MTKNHRAIARERIAVEKSSGYPFRMSETVPEPNDNHIYYVVSFNGDTFRFFLKSLRFYLQLLQKGSQELNLDDDLREFLDDKPERASVLDQEAKRVARVIEWYEQIETKEGKDAWDYEIGSLSHGTVRFTKSVGLLYLRQLRHKRNHVARRPNFSKYLLEAIDSQLARYEEKMLTAGVFANASPTPLLVEEAATAEAAIPDMAAPAQPNLAQVPRPVPVLLDTIPILDPDLRSRCLDLFTQFYDAQQHERFDTVLSDATRVLEDRLRAILGTEGKTGDDLAVAAFGGNTPKLQVSSVSAEQQGVLLFFKGIFSHIRNPVHHKLQTGFTPDALCKLWV